jgi:methylated-DNA-[protein]-cysteine S-methyltransferase
MLAPEDAFAASLEARYAVASPEEGLAAARRHLTVLAAAFERHFETGSGGFEDISLDLVVGSTWDRLVLEGVRTIPPGHVATYGEVAARVGRFGAARAVGGAVGRNPIAVIIPCHRVIAAGGRIGGYGGDWYGSRAERLRLKRDLLALEGIVLGDDPRVGDRDADAPSAANRRVARTPALA